MLAGGERWWWYRLQVRDAEVDTAGGVGYTGKGGIQGEGCWGRHGGWGGIYR